MTYRKLNWTNESASRAAIEWKNQMTKESITWLYRHRLSRKLVGSFRFINIVLGSFHVRSLTIVFTSIYYLNEYIDRKRERVNHIGCQRDPFHSIWPEFISYYIFLLPHKQRLDRPISWWDIAWPQYLDCPCIIQQHQFPSKFL